WKCAADPSTDVWCCAYAVDDGPVQLWVAGDPVPPEFVAAANSPAWTVAAHNANFERLITRHIMGPRYGWPTIPVDRYRCTMAAVLALALPGALDKVAEALNLKNRKDDDGHRVMLMMAKPKPGGSWYDDEARREKLYAYCKQDVEVERELH